jgi:uncharacterized integral membrane protein
MKPKTIIILILIVLALIVFIQNTEIVNLQLLFWKISMSRIIFMAFLLIVGFGLGYLVATLVKK